MQRYLAVFVPTVEGGYTVIFPDLPEIVTEGVTLDEAMNMAEDILAETANDYASAGMALPLPSSLESVRTIAQLAMHDRGVDHTRTPIIQDVRVLSPAVIAASA